MNRLLAAFVVAFILSPPTWWNTLLHSTATTFGLNTARDEEPATAEPPAGSTSDSGASWDPIGG